MSAFYDLASLVFLPSGYKSGKLYAQKPLTTDGQLTFTRASSATRVASNGLIEKVRTNLVLQSQTFDNASWTKTTDGQVTITANAAVAPDGTTTAEKMIPSAIAGFHCVQQGVSIGASEISVSIFAKAAEYSFLQIFDSLTTEFANFNLTTGVVGSTDTYAASIESVGNGWYRCKATKTAPSGTFNFRYGVVTSGTAVRGESFTGNGINGLLIWGAQLETGITTDYIPTTTAAVSVGPVSGLPRLDYLNSTCPKLLLEPSRTNAFTYSSDFSNAAWQKFGGSTVTPNATPSSIQGDLADQLNAAIGAEIAQPFAATAGLVYTVYFHFKISSSATVRVRFSDGGPLNATVDYNLTATTATLVSSNYGGTAKISNAGNGFKQCEFTFTMPAGTLFGAIFPFISNNVFCALGQMEQGAYATSYIPTLGASVTRVADAASKTGISSLIGQTEGTMFVEFEYQPTSASQSVAISDGTSSNRLDIRLATSNVPAFVAVTGGVIQSSISSAVTMTQGQRVKVAAAYKNNDFVLYQNGALVASTTSGTIGGTLSRYGFDLNGAQFFYSPVNQALVFKTRLTNAQLAELTAL